MAEHNLAVVGDVFEGGIDLSDLVTEHATLKLGGRNGKYLNVAYNPSKVTPQALVGDDAESFGRALIDFEVTWDLVDKGKPVPNTMAGYMGTALAILSLVFNGILKAQRVDPK